MPLYEFVCPDGHEDSFFRSIEKRDDLDVCLHCGKLMHRVISPVRHEILFKPGYFNTVGSYCDTEMEYHNKYSRAVDKVVEDHYSGGGRKSRKENSK